MNIEELILKTASTPNLINDILVEQLKLLAEQNSGNIPYEFILSDNKLLCVTFDSVLEFLKSLGFELEDFYILTTQDIKNIPVTSYTENFNVLYYVKIFED